MTDLIGFIYLFTLMVWFVILLVLNTWIFLRYVSRLPRRIYRGAILIVQILLGVIEFHLPTIDDEIGRYEVEALCNGPEGSYLKIDAEKIKGKRVNLVISHKDLEGTVVPITQAHHSYRDVETDEEYAETNWYYGQGGWLYRKIPGNAPGHLRPRFMCHNTQNTREIKSSYQFELANILYENYLWDYPQGDQ